MRAMPTRWYPVERKPIAKNVYREHYWQCPNCRTRNDIDSSIKPGDWDECNSCGYRVTIEN